MNNVFTFAILFALLTFAYASVSIGNYQDPQHPGKCVVGGNVYEPGVHTDHDDCSRITCSEGGFVEIADCGAQGAGPGCKLGKALQPEADYPDCCRLEIICSDD